MSVTQSTRPRRARLKGRDVALVVAAAILATAIAPPLAAWRLNQSRVDSAAQTAGTIAVHLRNQRESLSPAGQAGEIVCGPGRLPQAGDNGRAWLAAPTSNADLFGPQRPTDPWGRCYLVNLSGLATGEPVLLLSAGPNALIDTPIGASQPAGDDVGVRVW